MAGKSSRMIGALESPEAKIDAVCSHGNGHLRTASNYVKHGDAASESSINILGDAEEYVNKVMSLTSHCGAQNTTSEWPQKTKFVVTGCRRE